MSMGRLTESRGDIGYADFGGEADLITLLTAHTSLTFIMNGPRKPRLETSIAQLPCRCLRYFTSDWLLAISCDP
jgi:hypothetical protein